MAKFDITTHYPVSDEYEYTTELIRINMDDEKAHDITSGKGFIVTSSKPIRDDIKDPRGIFSNKFGMTLQDVEPFADRCRCTCGAKRSRFNLGEICPICNTTVKQVGDDFSYFGWIVLKDPYHVIHPTLYMSLSSFIGADAFENILDVVAKKDEDGNDMPTKIPKNEPFFGIGMMEFYNRFDEVMLYYKNKHRTQTKQELYDDIMKNSDKIFIQSIPVFTTILRPYKLEGGEFHFEGTNAIYKMCATLAERINKDNLRMTRKSKTKNELLYNLQKKIKKLFQEINAILSGKKGSEECLMDPYGESHSKKPLELLGG